MSTTRLPDINQQGSSTAIEEPASDEFFDQSNASIQETARALFFDSKGFNSQAVFPSSASTYASPASSHLTQQPVLSRFTKPPALILPTPFSPPNSINSQTSSSSEIQVPQAPIKKKRLTNIRYGYNFSAGSNVGSTIQDSFYITSDDRQIKRSDFFRFYFPQISSSSSSDHQVIPKALEGNPQHKLPFRYTGTHQLIPSVSNEQIILLRFKELDKYPKAKDYYSLLKTSYEQYRLAKMIFGDRSVTIYNNPIQDLYFANELIPLSLEAILKELSQRIQSPISTFEELYNPSNPNVVKLKSLLEQIKAFYLDALVHLQRTIGSKPIEEEVDEVSLLGLDTPDARKRKREDVKFFDPDFNIGNFRAVETNGSYQLKLTDFREKVDYTDRSDPLSHLRTDFNFLRNRHFGSLITRQLFDEFFSEVNNSLQALQDHYSLI